MGEQVLALTEHVRRALGRRLVQPYLAADGRLHAVALARSLDARLAAAGGLAETRPANALGTEVARELIRAVAMAVVMDELQPVAVDAVAAEVAFAVLDEFQGRGIGTLLLRHLAQIARRQGIIKFAAFVMGDNHQMLEVFANSGFRSRDRYDAGTVRVTLDLPESPGDFGHKT